MENMQRDVSDRIMKDKHSRTSVRRSGHHRTIYVNDAERNAGFAYINNKIRTSKYNLLTFLPRNLFEQFQRVANFYFLCFLILLMIPYLSPFMPIIFILPLGTVLAFTAVKDAYDDIERHRNDRRVNSRIALILRNGVLIEEKWENVVVGDIIRLENDHFVTADILLLSTSEPHGLCYIETSELDGETNLKCRQCLSETAALGDDHRAIGGVRASITCEAPNEILNRFEGVLKWNYNGSNVGPDDAVNDSCMQQQPTPATRFLLPLTNDQLLLRGCVLRNTQWCYGVVIFAGKDTKLMQNSGKTKHKRTTVDYLLNYIIIGIAMFLISLCVICSLSRNLWEIEYINFRQYMPWLQVAQDDWKVEPRSVGVAAPIGVGQDIIKSLDEVIEQTKRNPKFDKFFGRTTQQNLSSSSNSSFSDSVVIEPIVAVVAVHATGSSSTTPATYGTDYMTIATISFFAFFSYAILMSGLVPISLYVSIEIVRLIHSWWINWDREMSYNGERARARSTTLSDELGQVEYIFSDKTGTLTQNVMTFKSCSIGGRMFGLLCDAYGNVREPCESRSGGGDKRVNFAERNRMADADFAFYDHNLWQLILEHNSSRCGSRPTSPLSSCDGNQNVLPNVTYTMTTDDDEMAATWETNFILEPLAAEKLTTQHHIARQMSENLAAGLDADMLFRLLSICHTVMPGEKNGQLIYQAQSPDEGALVCAARNFGYVFCQRTPHSITVQHTLGVAESELVFDLLAILDFNNARRRMSVIVRDPLLQNKIVIYTKGADCVVFERLADTAYNRRVRISTDEHLDRFAGEGLRTLVLAYRVIEEDEFEEWQTKHFRPASVAEEDRDDKLDEAYDKIEQNLTLIGATAIEDKLQDGVADTIANILQAGVYVWVLTGDKMETAVNIGYSCKLLTDHLETVFVIDATNDAAELHDQLLQAKYCIDQSSSHSQQQSCRHAAANSVDAEDDYAGGDKIARHAADGIDAAADQKVPLNIEKMRDCSDCADVAVVVNRGGHGGGKNNNVTAIQMPPPPPSYNNDPTGSGFYAVVHENPLHNVITNGDGATGDGPHHHVIMMHAEESSSRSPTARVPSTKPHTHESPPLPPPIGSPKPSCSSSSGGFALVVNGSSLCQAMELGLIDLFLDLALKCKTVIVCRATPLQKALVVKLIRARCQAVTLAIGDGANDVSMIKEAHVGVGISGQEGMQAVMASDFSIAQFRFLQRLLLVHGRWSYYRMSKFLRYFFYKNFACYLTHFFYAWYSGFTTLSVYDPWFLTFYNMFYTALPVLAMAAFDQDVDASNCSKFPQLYALGLRMRFFNYKTFFLWAGGGSLTSFLLFYVVMLNFDDLHLLAPYHSFALALATILVLVVTVQICLDTDYWTWINVVTVVVSLASFFIFAALQSSTTSPPKWQSQFLGVFSLLFFRCEFWLTALLCIVLFSAPVVAGRCLDTELNPTLAVRIKWRQLAHVRMRSSRSLQLQAEREYWRRRRHESTRKRQQPAVRSSYAFSHEAGFARLITEGVNMRGEHSGLAVSNNNTMSNSNNNNKQHVIKRIAKWPATAAVGLLSNLSQPAKLGSSLSSMMMKRSTSDAGPLGDAAAAAAASSKKCDSAADAGEKCAVAVAAAAEFDEIAVVNDDAAVGIETALPDIVDSALMIQNNALASDRSVFCHAEQPDEFVVLPPPSSPLLLSNANVHNSLPYTTTSRVLSPDHFLYSRRKHENELQPVQRLRSTSVDRPPDIVRNSQLLQQTTTVVVDVCSSSTDNNSIAKNSSAYMMTQTVPLAHVDQLCLRLSNSANETTSSSGVFGGPPTAAAHSSSSTLPNRQLQATDEVVCLKKQKSVRFQQQQQQQNALITGATPVVQRPKTLAMQTIAATVAGGGGGAVAPPPPASGSLASRHSNILHLQQLAAAKKRQQQLLLEQQQQSSNSLLEAVDNATSSPPSSSPAPPPLPPGNNNNSFASGDHKTRANAAAAAAVSGAVNSKLSPLSAALSKLAALTSSGSGGSSTKDVETADASSSLNLGTETLGSGDTVMNKTV